MLFSDCYELRVCLPIAHCRLPIADCVILNIEFLYQTKIKVMLKNYLLVAFRNLKRNKVFSFINILGLALGMACSLLIFLWVNDERNMDRFNKNTERLYSVYERQFYDNKIDAFHSTPGVLADEMKKVLPDVQYASGYAWNDLSTFQVGDKIMKERGNHAGADFFKMFS